jgi:hypothetical protein
MRSSDGAATSGAAGGHGAGKLEELLDQVHGLRIERSPVCFCVCGPCRGRFHAQANIQCLYLCVYVCLWGGGGGTFREQLYAQIQADAAMKKAQEEVCGV